MVTELAVRLNLPLNNSPIPETLLRGADEIWLSFATRGLLPVTSLDGASRGLRQTRTAVQAQYVPHSSSTPTNWQGRHRCERRADPRISERIPDQSDGTP